MINEILSYKPQKNNLWKGKYKIPWNDPEFSKRMLKMHLSQEHDMASRRSVVIEKQTQWIHENFLQDKCSHILDLGCGPGFYLKKLSDLGHNCTGIDFSPSAIEYAKQSCSNVKLMLGDITNVTYGENYDLIMILFGEINVFSPQECKLILNKAYNALKTGGILIIEAYLFEAVKKIGQSAKNWFRSNKSKKSTEHWFDNVINDSLFSEEPHIILIENNWLEDEQIALSNFWILEDNKNTCHYISTTRAYTEQQYINLFKDIGFQNITNRSFGEASTDSSDFCLFTGMK